MLASDIIMCGHDELSISIQGQSQHPSPVHETRQVITVSLDKTAFPEARTTELTGG